MPEGTVLARSRPPPKLLAVKPEHIEPKRPKILVYGPPGAGKTWWAIDWGQCYFIDTEGGADLDHYRAKLRANGSVYMGPDQGSLDFDVVTGQIQALATVEHPYRTVVIDSISRLWNAALADEQEALGSRDVFGAYKKLPTRKFATLLKWINRLDMNSIFIGHQKEIWGTGENKQREVIGYGPDVQDKMEYDLHLVLRVAKLGNSRYGYVGKSRLPSFKEGDRFDWTYTEFAQRFGKDVIEKPAAPLTLATPEQVEEVVRLMEIVKMPDDWQDKVWKKAGVDMWAEMDAAKVDNCIAMLRGRMTS